MTFKTNKSQLTGLELLLRLLLHENRPINIAEKLIYSHVTKAYSKARAKIEAAFVGNANWNIALTDQEAWALHVFYYNIAGNIDEQEYHYEALNLQSIINQIDQKYNGKISTTDHANRGLAAGSPTRRLGGTA